MAEIIAHKDISQDIFEHVSIIRQSGDNLLAIINDILDFSKIEVGQLVIASDKYYISSLINDALNVTRVRLIEKPVMFSLRVDCDLPECLYGDNVRIRQVLLNLLSNAIKYTSEGFITLEVTFEELPNEQIKLIFRVSDSGIGIQLEDIEELFTDFTRVESATTHAVEGSGLGLSIARSLCRAMGGDIVVTSEFGSGSVFQAEVIQGKEPGRKLATVDNAQEKSLLIFEDRPLYLESLLYATDSLGVPSQCVDSLEEFIALLKDNPKYAYAFVSSRYIAECLFILGSSVSTVRLVNMVDFGDASAYKNISNIIMPVYCVNIANLLNSAIGAGMPVNKDRMTRFFAPNAKVLIVDDIATNLRVSKELMALYGLNIHTCMSGSAAIELATLNRYDLVFMDHMMPIMDGVEAVARIRAIDPNDPYYRDLPIVALTANALTGQREALLQSGMNDFLEKPIDTQRLNTILLKWIPKEKQWNREELVNLPELSEQCRDLDIPGVSIETGLRNSGGSMPVFLDILSDFCADADLRRTQIEQSLKDNDLNLYMTLVHAMKGASRSVGVGEFADFAALMEEAARNQDRETIDKRTGELLSDLLELTQKIRTALKSFTESSQKVDDISDNQLEAQLLLLKPALKNMDIQTVNTTLLELVNVALTPQSRELVTSIERNILMFEYDDAIEKIDSVLKYRKP
jgi:CheY-like chemotaxis protein